MKTKKGLIIMTVLLLVVVVAVSLVGCSTNIHYDEFTLNGWERLALDRMGNVQNVDITKLKVENFINLEDLGYDVIPNGCIVNNYNGSNTYVNNEGWYLTLSDNFDNEEAYSDNYGLNKDIWAASRHDLRWASDKKNHPEYANIWCPNMITVKDSKVIIKASYEDNHNCEVCNSYGYTKGRFTSGFETRNEALVVDSNGKPILDANGKRQYKSNILWGQAFGYFETSIRFPNMDGMWSAFWLQGNEMREIGYDGKDGTEIDIYESAFRKDNDKMSRMGHALLWNGYGKSGKVAGHIGKLEQNLYDGKFHTFSLLWTPECYIFFIDGYATWATDAGGICRVPEFMRFTNEIDAGDGWGPHGQKIGQFDHNSIATMEVEYVRVYQKQSYLESIAPSIDGKEYSKDNNFESNYDSPYDTDN